MRQSKFPVQTKEEAQRLIKKTEKAAETKRLQCVLLGASGRSSEDIAPVVGYTSAHVRLVWKWFREGGFERLIGEQRGKSRNRAYLTKEDENEFLEPFEEKAIQGKIVTVNDLHKRHKELLKKEIDLATTYRLLSRRGWRKIVPRPEHPKHNPKLLKEFKEAIFPPGYDPYEGVGDAK